MRVYTNATSWSSRTITIPNVATPEQEVVLLSSFTQGGASPVDFTKVGAIELEIVGAAEVDGSIDTIGMLGPTVKSANFANLSPMSIGDLVWRDTNNDGVFGSGESGIAAVALTLFQDTNGSGDFTPGTDTQVATATTNASGIYTFSNLLPGEYLVIVDAANFTGSGALVGLVSSTGNDPAPDPDNDVNNDDNGTTSGLLVAARALTLQAGIEPTTDGDTNANSNLTVDFGFTQVADLAIAKTDNKLTAVPGTSNVYTLTVTNNGPSSVTSVIVTDTLPATLLNATFTAPAGTTYNATTGVWSGLNLAQGQSISLTLTATVAPTATGNGAEHVRVDPPAGVIDTNPGNNTANDEDQLTPQVDLTM